MPHVLGVDGCRGGWIACARPAEGSARTIEWSLLERIDELPAASPEPARGTRVAIDMPIGLRSKPDGSGASARDCDRDARRVLGRRACTLFSPPTRAALRAREFRKGLGISLQSFHLFPKIRELDAWMTPAKQRRIHEAHPELAFTRLRRGRVIESPKRIAEGREARLRVLRRRLGRAVDTRIAEALDRWPRKVVAADDLVDAVALSVVAEAIEGGDAVRFPRCDAPERDARGLRMEIWS